jgi:hypothetical protein
VSREPAVADAAARDYRARISDCESPQPDVLCARGAIGRPGADPAFKRAVEAPSGCLGRHFQWSDLDIMAVGGSSVTVVNL